MSAVLSSMYVGWGGIERMMHVGGHRVGDVLGKTTDWLRLRWSIDDWLIYNNQNKQHFATAKSTTMLNCYVIRLVTIY